MDKGRKYMIRQIKTQVIQVSLIFLVACGSGVTPRVNLDPNDSGSQSPEITPSATYFEITQERQATPPVTSTVEHSTVPTITDSPTSFYMVTPPTNVQLLNSDSLLATFPERLNHFDGFLQMHISEIESTCRLTGQVFQIEVNFINVSQEVLVFNRQLDSGWGKPMLPLFNLVFDITDQNGQVVHFSSENPGFIIGSVYSDNDFITLPPEGHYESVIDMVVPMEKINVTGYERLQSGSYYLAATYGNLVVGPTSNNITSMSGQYDWNAWVGKVESNQIEICIENP
jgi:hypothetical protein